MKKILFILSLLFISHDIHAAEIMFRNGDKITGEILSQTPTHITLQSEILGTITFDKNLIKKPEPKKAEPDVKWSGEIATGFERKRGNTNSTALTGGAKFKREAKNRDYSGGIEMIYGSENRKMDEQKYNAFIRSDWKWGKDKRWFNFAELKYNHDKFANIDWRAIPTAGFGYKWFNEETFKLFTEIGLAYSKTEYISGDSEEDELQITPKIHLEKKLFKSSKLIHDTTAYPSLTETGEFRIESVTAFENPLSKKLKLSLKLIDEYNSNPGSDTKKNDIHLITQLVYTL